MATDPDVDTSRTVVQVYVPAYQRDLWDEHADELDMNRSEFVKTMVQAGRKVFDGETVSETTGTQPDSESESTSKGELRSRVLSRLRENDCLEWEELLAEVTGDIEARLESTLKQLQDESQVRYSGREGGYILESEGE